MMLFYHKFFVLILICLFDVANSAGDNREMNNSEEFCEFLKVKVGNIRQIVGEKLPENDEQMNRQNMEILNISLSKYFCDKIDKKLNNFSENSENLDRFDPFREDGIWTKHKELPGFGMRSEKQFEKLNNQFGTNNSEVLVINTFILLKY